MFNLIFPVALKLFSFILDKSKASAETKAQMLTLIKSAQNDGLISKANKDELKKQRDEIAQQQKGK